MLVNGRNYSSIWRDQNSGSIKIIDQRWLPHRLQIAELNTFTDVETAISEMWVRGAPLIGVTAAYGMAIAMTEDSSNRNLLKSGKKLCEARPTAINLNWAVEKINKFLSGIKPERRTEAALNFADKMAKEDIIINQKIGKYGCTVIEDIAKNKVDNSPVRILTHCNAGWLATVDYGTATAPIYEAYGRGLNLEVWVDETRPRNQGAALTTWELSHNDIPHTLLVDSAAGHLMQHGKVDLCIVGSDRTTATGDVCNKVGTYLKALAAHDNKIPFFAALPTSTIDFSIDNGIAEIPIEERSADEVLNVQGMGSNGEISSVAICSAKTKVTNPAFDVTPRHLVTGIITEFGVWDPLKPYPFK